MRNRISWKQSRKNFCSRGFEVSLRNVKLSEKGGGTIGGEINSSRFPAWRRSFINRRVEGQVGADIARTQSFSAWQRDASIDDGEGASGTSFDLQRASIFAAATKLTRSSTDSRHPVSQTTERIKSDQRLIGKAKGEGEKLILTIRSIFSSKIPGSVK